jgi:hypothetical protein
MAFKENKDGISIDKGATTEEDLIVLDSSIQESLENKADLVDGQVPTNQLDLTGYATEGYVDTAIENVVGLAPEDLNTLSELADALGDNPAAITTLQSDVSALETGKADLVNGFVREDQLKFIQEEGISPTYIALQRFGGSAVSTDAITWTAYTSFNRNLPTDSIYATNKFVVIGNDYTLVSTDGVLWTDSNLPSNARSIAYASGKFVTVPYGPGSSLNSTDAVTWTTTTMPNGGWSSVTYGNGMFVAVAKYSHIWNSTNYGAYSTDGITCTVNTSMPFQQWNNIVYANEKFVVTDSSSNSAYSTDGITWSTGGSLPVAGYYLLYGNDRFVIVDYSGGNSAYSTDGISWAGPYESPIDIAVFDAGYGNGKFFALGYNSSSGAYSTDGVTWTQTTVPQGYWGKVGYGAVPVTSTQEIASKYYVDTTIESLIDTAPEALNTLNELSAALNDDENFATTVTTALSNKSGLTVVEPSANTNTAISVGYVGLPQVILNSGNLTLSKTHAGKHIYITGASQTVTIPSIFSVDFQVGTTIVVINAGVTSTISPDGNERLQLAGATAQSNYGESRTLAAYGMATLAKLDSETWIISGNGLT